MALALAGDGGCIDLVVEDGKAAELCGEPAGRLSSLLPNIDEIDMPAPDRCDDAKLARSRTPANGDAVGGPRGPEPGSDDDAEEGI